MNVDWLNEISGENIEKIINDIADLSALPNGGRNAQAFSEEEDKIFRYIRAYTLELNKSYSYSNRNLDTYEDAIGNLYITLDSDKDMVAACGSHVDSVTEAGKYDGVMGVAAGLEILRILYEKGVSAKHGFCLIVFRAEESSTTGVATLGSAVATGQVSKEYLESLKFGEKSFRDVMKERGKEWDDILALAESPILDRDRYRCFLEFHIEQGRVLEKGGHQLGIVDKGIGGAERWLAKKKISPKTYTLSDNEKVYTFRVRGIADHSGGTPMNGVRGEHYRYDALVKSCLFIEMFREKTSVKVQNWYTPHFVYNCIAGEVVVRLILEDGWREKIDEEHLRKVDVLDQIEDGEVLVWEDSLVDSTCDLIRVITQTAEKYAKDTDGLIAATVAGLKIVDADLQIKIDFRNLDVDLNADFLSEMSEYLLNNSFDKTVVSSTPPSFFEAEVVDGLGKIHKELFNKDAFYLPSMPGHDARNMCRKGIPTGMIFSPCREGISHSPAEHVSTEVMEIGAKLLAAGLVYFANR